MPSVSIMAILNVTPDSFSDGGSLSTEEQILAQAQSALDAGASILDIGGESTRPGAKIVPPEEEIARVVPAIRAIAHHFPAARISIDTRKSPVAEAALQAGATMVNDVSGLQYNPALADVCTRHGAGLVITHSQGTPDTMQKNPTYPEGVVETVYRFFERQIALACQTGMARETLILDPGFGFGKTLSHNLQLLNELNRFLPLGLPILAGTSRKSFLTLGQSSPPPAEREALTAASLTIAISKGATMVRVHQPEIQVPVVRFAEAALASNKAKSPAEAVIS